MHSYMPLKIRLTFNHTRQEQLSTEEALYEIHQEGYQMEQVIQLPLPKVNVEQKLLVFNWIGV